MDLSVSPSWVSGAASFFSYQAFNKLLDIPISSMVLVGVKREHRGKFFHLLSIKPLTFGASALLGGFIVDAYGYRQVVATTGLSLLFLATPLLLLVCRLEFHAQG